MRYLLYWWILVAGISVAAADAPHPSILLILVDDMGWGDLGCFYQNERAKSGQPAMATPHLDQMASEGIQLRRHYAGAPVCAPSRASLFSGVHQGNARTIRDNAFDMPLENSHTLASMLKQAGYATALIGKWGLGGGQQQAGNPNDSTAYPTKRGFDYFFGYLDHIAGHRHYPAHDPGTGPRNVTAIWDQDRIITQDCNKAYSTDLLTARAKKWIYDHEKANHDSGNNQPFFLALTYIAPHAALRIPTCAYPAGGGLNGGVQWLGQPGRLVNTAQGVIDSYIMPPYKDQPWPESEPWPESAKRFATMVGRVDEAIGDILQLLKDLKIDRNTLVVFTSDNGPHNASSFLPWRQDPSFFRSYGPFDGLKRDLLEGGIRVPTIVRWPDGIPSQQITDTPSQFHDWMATFAELAGVPTPARTDGVSLVPTLTGCPDQQQPSTIYVEYHVSGKTPALADFAPQHRQITRRQQQLIGCGPYIGVRMGIKSHQDDFQIFDIAKDPRELHDLASQSPEIQKQMKDRVLQIRRVYDYSHQKRGMIVHRPYDDEFVPNVEAKNVQPGLKFSLIANKALPWAAQATSHRTETQLTPGIQFPDTWANDTKGFAAQWQGFIRIPKDGDYHFFVQTDANDGTRAFVRLHGQGGMVLVDADYPTHGQEVDSSAAIGATEADPHETGKRPVKLRAGLHPITISYVHGAGQHTPRLKFSWQGPDRPHSDIPTNFFVHVP